MALDSGTEDKKYPVFFFTQVNRRVNPYTTKPEELRDCLNWWTETTIGAKKVRPGYRQFLDKVDSDPVTGLFYVKFPNGKIRLARISGGKIYAIDPTDNTVVAWGSALYSQAHAFIRPDYTVLEAKAHIVSQISTTESPYLEWTNSGGVDTIADTTYDAGTPATLVIPYRGKTVQQYHRKVYSGSPFYSPSTFKSQLSWSVIDYQTTDVLGNTITPWTTKDNDLTTANFTPVDTDYKGSVLKLTETQDRLNIYKEGGVYSFNESSLFSLFGLAPFQGSIANMEETSSDYFMTNEGFFSNDGQTVKPIGEGWYPLIKQILQNGLDQSKIVSTAFNFLYFCYVGQIEYDGKIITNAMFVYNIYYGELYLWSLGHDMTSLGYYTDASGEKHLVMGDRNGFTYILDYTKNDDAGTKILAHFETKYYFFDEPEKKNQVSEVHAFASPGSELEVSVDPDFQGDYEYNVLFLKRFFAKHKFDTSIVGAFQTLSAKIMWNGRGGRPEFYGLIFNIKQDSSRTNKNSGNTRR